VKELQAPTVNALVSSRDAELERAKLHVALPWNRESGVISMSSLRAEHDLTSMPLCNHTMMMPIESKEDIDTKNKQIRDDFERDELESATTRSRGSKPKMKKNRVPDDGMLLW
jgi:hypothetical protein